MTILPEAIYRFNESQMNIKLISMNIKLPMALFTELAQKKFCISIQIVKRPQMGKTNLRKKKSWKAQISWLHTIPQSYSNQNSMVLAQKQKYRSMK